MRFKNLLVWLVLPLIVMVGVVFGLLTLSLGPDSGSRVLPGLHAASTVSSDALGIPKIQAVDREDAFRSLGFLHARDRLFQMELMRRRSAGRLAEIFGSVAVKLDRQQRHYQLMQAARQIVADLPVAQQQVLAAYVAGINAYLQQVQVLPWEFLALRFAPEPWQAEDTILVALGMFQTLNGEEQDERMVTVMQKALPAELVTFLTPDTDSFATPLVGGNETRRWSPSVPEQAFAQLQDAPAPLVHASVDVNNAIAGSNNWVIAGSKTADGRAIVANDMHLGLSVPNIWYRAELSYQNMHLFGVTLPGVPAVVVGGNDFVAWGFTNATVDLLDLITLEVNPANPQEYRTPEGWQPFVRHTETLKVKNAPDEVFEVLDTQWGPVSEHKLLGNLVAVKWIALAKHAVDLGLQQMDTVQTTAQAIAVFNNTGGPAQNVVIADREGHIAWTYMGRLPWRKGFEGLVSESWADGQKAWQGFIPADALPRLVDPAEGFIATANNRTVGRDYPYPLAHNWALSYRAFRISELLREGSQLGEQDMLNIQLDSRSEVLDFYQQLGLSELHLVQDKNEFLSTAELALQSWEGYMQFDSLGAIFVSEFRSQLAKAVFAKVVNQCRQVDPDFRYAWREMETPLRQILTAQPKHVLNSEYQDDWHRFLLDILLRTTVELQKQYPGSDLTKLTWGDAHQISVRHPLSKNLPQLAQFLDMPSFPLEGCTSLCVKILSNEHGASERLVVSPQHPEQGILQMPGGQSGQPLSGHYRDQQAAWQEGKAQALLVGKAVKVLQLVP